jgi:hypothetical protein
MVSTIKLIADNLEDAATSETSSLIYSRYSFYTNLVVIEQRPLQRFGNKNGLKPVSIIVQRNLSWNPLSNILMQWLIRPYSNTKRICSEAWLIQTSQFHIQRLINT